MKSEYIAVERQFKMTLDKYPAQFDLISEESSFLAKIGFVVIILLGVLAITTKTILIPLILFPLPLALFIPLIRETISFYKGLRKNKEILIQPVKAKIKEEMGIELSSKGIATMWNYVPHKTHGKQYLISGRQGTTFFVVVSKA